MICKEIPYQKAYAIIKKHSDLKFNIFEISSECLLRTGAKVLKHNKKYYLSGYAESGDDIKGM